MMRATALQGLRAVEHLTMKLQMMMASLKWVPAEEGW
jgi:hypothetical protein